MADATAAGPVGASGISEADASIGAVGAELLESADAAASSAPEGRDDAAAIAPEQEQELESGADALQQAADDEAALDEPSAVANAHLAGQPTQPRSSAQDNAVGEPDDENAQIQPSAREGELEDEDAEEKPAASQATTTGGADDVVDDNDMDEDFELTEQDRAQIAAEIAGLQDEDRTAEDDPDDDLRYRHAILDDDDEDEAPAGERIRKKHKTSHDRPAVENEIMAALGESEGIQLSEKERRALEINRRIDQALKVGKKKRTRKMDNVDDLEKISDESVEQLKIEMIEAADRDENANINKGLVIEKLKLLPKVLATLQKTHLQQAITDHNLLEGVRRWLEPLPDHSLPALNIQRSFFSVLEKMPIDSISLKMSGLGKIMMFYSMNTKVDPAIRRSADRLIEIWSRPIIKKSSSFRDRSMEKADFDPSAVQFVGSQGASGAASSSQGSQVPLSAGAASRVRVPQAVTGYSVVPRSMVGVGGGGGGGGESASQSRMKNAAKLRTFKSKLKDSKQR
ncbi:hypothetical protein V8E36_009809 [Tilletia maclaganii]